MSIEEKNYLKKLKINKIKIIVIQILIATTFLTLWEYLSRKEIINSFIFSSPTKILLTLKDLSTNNNILYHIYITLKELFISFFLGTLIGFIGAILFYFIPTLKKILDPYLNLINSLPKVSLGPLLIIWLGANTKSIIVMSLLINTIVTLITIYNGLINTDEYKIKMFKTFKATKKQILFNLVLPSNLETILSSIKLNISMSLIGM